MASTAERTEKLSDHQKRVLSALLALMRHHDWRWWDRSEIGLIVGAGGYHATIQVSTMRVLKQRGLIQSERSSWDAATQSLVQCNCGCGRWGLTSDGERIADTLPIRWTDEALSWFQRTSPPSHFDKRDEDEDPRYGGGWSGDDDDRGGDPVLPSTPLVGAGA